MSLKLLPLVILLIACEARLKVNTRTGGVSIAPKDDGASQTATAQTPVASPVLFPRATEIFYEESPTFEWEAYPGAATYGFTASSEADDCADKTVFQDGLTEPKIVRIWSEGTYFVCVDAYGTDGVKISETGYAKITVMLTVPLQAIGPPAFVDADYSQGAIAGLLSFGAGVDAWKVEKYSVYLGSTATDLIGSIDEPLALGYKGDTANIEVNIPPGTSIPGIATHLLVFAENGIGKSAVPLAFAFSDRYPRITSRGVMSWSDQPTWYQATGLIKVNEDLVLAVVGVNTNESTVVTYRLEPGAMPSNLGSFQGSLCCLGSRMVVAGTRLFNQPWIAGLKVYDFATSASGINFGPELLNIPQTDPRLGGVMDSAEDLAFFADVLYAGGGPYGTAKNMVRVLDMADLGNVTGLDLTLGVGESGIKLAVHQERLYVSASSSRKLYVYTLENPKSPQLLTTISNIGGSDVNFFVHSTMTFSGNLMAIAAASLPGIQLFDIDQGGLTLKTTIPLVSAAASLQFSGRYLFVTTANEIVAFDMLDLANPVQVASEARLGQRQMSDLLCSVTKGVCLASAGINDPRIQVFDLADFVSP